MVARSPSVLAACLTLLSATIPQQAIGQERQPTAAQIAEWRRLGEPGPAHERLAPLVGRWTFRITFGDASDGQSAAGETEYKLLMGGRFLVEESRTTFAGQPFEWIGIHGYDNVMRKYTSAWIDNLGTQIDRMDASFDSGANRLTYEGDDANPGQGKVRVRWAIDFQSRDSYTVTMTEIAPSGAEQVRGTIVATRAR